MHLTKGAGAAASQPVVEAPFAGDCECSAGTHTGAARSFGLARGLLVTCLAVCGLAAQCPVLFQHPLGPVASAVVDQRLVGVWRCQDSTETPTPGIVTISDFDGHQYLFVSVPDGEEPAYLRAFATLIDGEPFLNLRELGIEGKPEWMIARYEVPDVAHLSFGIVDPNPFQEVINKPRQVRKLLERRRKLEGLTVSWMTCVKREVSQ